MKTFVDINLKLGNMRKAQDFTLYPVTDPSEVTIQSSNRIAQINTKTGKGVLSDGKGGHQGFHKLNPFLGATEVELTKEQLDLIMEGISQQKPLDEAGGISLFN